MCPHVVGARRCLARPRRTARHMHRDRHVPHDTRRRSAERPSPRSPGRERLQPRAFAAHHPRRGHHRTAAPIGMRYRPSRAGRVRHRLTPTGRGLHPPVAPECPTGDAPRHVCRGEALPRPPAPHGAAMHRGRPPPPWSSPHRDTHRHALPALRAGRVRHRLTPTGQGQRPTVAPICPIGDGFAHVVGARRCLARPRRTAREPPVPIRRR
jgi:hypothetical protein